MKVGLFNLGFSLVEVLVALFVVSLSAVNISGLQKIVADQSRNNSSYTTVIGLVSERIEELRQVNDMQKIIDLNGATLTHTEKGILFTLTWTVEMASGAPSTSPSRDVSVQVTWRDASGEVQTFSYSEQISLALLLQGVAGEDNFSYTIPNLLNTTQVNYFDSKIGYQKEAYIIYDSQLFQATTKHSLVNEKQNEVLEPINEDGSVASGWERLGRIDNRELANLFIEQ